MDRLELTTSYKGTPLDDAAIAMLAKFSPKVTNGLADILKGEGKGHPFRGNQYTGGMGGSEDNRKPPQPLIPDDVVRGSDEMWPKIMEGIAGGGEELFDEMAKRMASITKLVMEEDRDGSLSDALQAYQGTGRYIEINAAARGLSGFDRYKADAKAIKEAMAQLDPLVLRGEVKALPAWRGLYIKDDKVDEFLAKFQQGKTVRVKGFQSVTMTPQVAVNFTKAGGGWFGTTDVMPKGGVILEISLSKALVLGGGENEYLVNHGTKYKVIGVKELPFLYRDEVIRKKVVQLEQVV